MLRQERRVEAKKKKKKRSLLSSQGVAVVFLGQSFRKGTAMFGGFTPIARFSVGKKNGGFGDW